MPPGLKHPLHGGRSQTQMGSQMTRALMSVRFAALRKKDIGLAGHTALHRSSPQSRSWRAMVMTQTPIAAASSFRVRVATVVLLTPEYHPGEAGEASHFADARVVP